MTMPFEREIIGLAKVTRERNFEKSVGQPLLLKVVRAAQPFRRLGSIRRMTLIMTALRALLIHMDKP